MNTKKIVAIVLFFILISSLLGNVLNVNYVMASETKENQLNGEIEERFNLNSIFNQFRNYIVGKQETRSYDVEIKALKTELTPGEEFEVVVSLENLVNIEKGFTAIGGKIEYSKDVLEMVPVSNGSYMQGLGYWNVSYNELTDLFVADSRQVKVDSDLLKIKFKVKETITESKTAEINFVDVEASEGDGLILCNEINPVKVNVKVVKYTDINFRAYTVNDRKVSDIPENTKVSDIKANIENPGNLPVVFKDKDGNVLEDDAVVKTGDQIVVNNSIIYTLEIKYTDISFKAYTVNDRKVSDIPENTKVSDIKANIENPGNLPVVFKDKDRNVLEDDAVVKTGDQIVVNNSIIYTLEVKYTDISFKAYTVNDRKISDILENTKVSDIKANIENPGNLPVVFKDKDGNVLADDAVVKTGDQIIVNDSIVYTLEVKYTGVKINKYKVEDTTISDVIEKTTVANFKLNIENPGNLPVVFKDKDGNVLADDALVTTETTIIINNEKVLDVVVTGDVDCNGIITANDLVQLKLHLIEELELKGLKKMAADMDVNSTLTINDLANIKLVLIDANIEEQ